MKAIIAAVSLALASAAHAAPSLVITMGSESFNGVQSITSVGSVTASAFFGDGSHLTGVQDDTKVAKAGDTMTGALTLASSSFSVVGSSAMIGGPLFVLSTGGAYALWVTTDVNNRGAFMGGPNSACPGCLGVGTPSAGGIGALTAGFNLQVNGSQLGGSSNSSGGASVPFRAQNSNSPAVSGASSVLGMRVGTSGGNVDVAGIAGVAENVAVSSGSMDFRVNAGASGNTLTTRMRLTSAGSLGVGTTVPATKMHLSSGTITIDGTGSPATGGALCLNAAGAVSKCTSAVGVTGDCTCP